MTLTDFLLARIAEDEERARVLAADATVGAPWKHFPEDAYNEIQSMALTLAHRTKVDARVKRRVVEFASEFSGETRYETGRRFALDETLRLLAAVYADHPDYREEWKP